MMFVVELENAIESQTAFIEVQRPPHVSQVKSQTGLLEQRR